MHGSAVLRRRSRIDRGANEGMAELHHGPNLDKLLGAGVRSRFWSDFERLRGTPKQGDVPGRIGSGDQHQSLGGLRQHFEAPEKVLLDLTRKTSRVGS